MLGKVKDIKASSAEILSELLVTALDCLHPKEDNFLVQSTGFYAISGDFHF